MMTSIRANVPAIADADQVPWYDLIDDVPKAASGVAAAAGGWLIGVFIKR